VRERRRAAGERRHAGQHGMRVGRLGAPAARRSGSANEGAPGHRRNRTPAPVTRSAAGRAPAGAARLHAAQAVACGSVHTHHASACEYAAPLQLSPSAPRAPRQASPLVATYSRAPRSPTTACAMRTSRRSSSSWCSASWAAPTSTPWCAPRAPSLLRPWPGAAAAAAWCALRPRQHCSWGWPSTNGMQAGNFALMSDACFCPSGRASAAPSTTRRGTSRRAAAPWPGRRSACEQAQGGQPQQAAPLAAPQGPASCSTSVCSTRAVGASASGRRALWRLRVPQRGGDGWGGLLIVCC